jgi:hypothetical protein
MIVSSTLWAMRTRSMELWFRSLRGESTDQLHNKRALTMGLTAYVDSTMTLLNLVVGGEQTVSGLVQNTGVDLDSPPSQQQFTSWNILAKTV